MKKAEQSESTRKALLQVARELFTERGYADTATQEIVERAGVTRGALYYHFRDKTDIFRAVFEDISLNVVTQVASAVQSAQGEQGDLWDRLVRVAPAAYLDACLDPAVQRIMLIDAVSVLGLEEKSALDEKHVINLARGAVQELMNAGLIAPQPLIPLIHLILSVGYGASLYIARADDMPTARKEMGASLERFFDGLRVKN